MIHTEDADVVGRSLPAVTGVYPPARPAHSPCLQGVTTLGLRCGGGAQPAEYLPNVPGTSTPVLTEGDLDGGRSSIDTGAVLVLLFSCCLDWYVGLYQHSVGRR